MRLLLAILLVLPTFVSAQSLINRALNETLNLTPRFERGYSQEMLLEVKYFYLDQDGTVNSIKRNQINYEQLCLVNSSDRLTYQVRIDSLKSGGKQSPGSDRSSFSLMTDFEGYSFELDFDKSIQLRDGCYAHDVNITEDMYYVESMEFLNMFLPVEIIERIRFIIAPSLSGIADSARVTLPGPICYSIPNVVIEHRLEQKPYLFWVDGITRHGSRACAIVKVQSDPSPLFVEFPSKENSWTGEGSIWLTGEFLVSLEEGFIVNAHLRQRMQAVQNRPDGTSKVNPVLIEMTLTQRN